MKNKINWALCVCISTVFIWGISWLLPILLPCPDNSTLSFLNIIFTAATALFTGIAFVVAFFSISKEQEILKQQQSTLIAQTRLSVLSETMRLVMDSERFLKSKKYILSPDYYTDIETVKKVLGIKGKVGLEDFKTLLVRGLKKNQFDDKERLELLDAYENITFFCARMDYLGSVSKEESVTDLIIDQYGLTIIESYKVLSQLIKRSREQSNRQWLYEHYTKLNEEAEKRLKERL